jgi:hypothetical protein
MFAKEDLVKQDTGKGLSLERRLHPKYSSAFDKLTDRDRAAVALYFLPHASEKDVLEVTLPRVIKWYCPFADQREFPSGHRYSINVYTGCRQTLQDESDYDALSNNSADPLSSCQRFLQHVYTPFIGEIMPGWGSTLQPAPDEACFLAGCPATRPERSRLQLERLHAPAEPFQRRRVVDPAQATPEHLS